MKGYKVLRNINEDIQELQNGLNSLEQWSTDWQLSFNTEKCEVMQIEKKNETSSPEYYLCGSKLKAVSGAKNLGIFIKKDIDILEKVQRRASRSALGDDAEDMAYEDGLKRLKRPKLEKRRTFSSLTECYKTINELNDLNKQEFFIFAD